MANSVVLSKKIYFSSRIDLERLILGRSRKQLAKVFLERRVKRISNMAMVTLVAAVVVLILLAVVVTNDNVVFNNLIKIGQNGTKQTH